MVEYTKTCPICQRIYTTNRKHKKTCSDACRTELYRRRKHATQRKERHVTEITHIKQDIQEYFPPDSISTWSYEKLMNHIITQGIPPQIGQLAIRLKREIEERAKQQEQTEQKEESKPLDIPEHIIREALERAAKLKQTKPRPDEP